MELNEINSIYKEVLSFTRNNPVFGGVVGLWGVGVITFLLKVVPITAFKFLKKQLTTTIVINNSDDVYYDFLRWVSETNLKSYVRSLNINTGSMWGRSSKHASLSVGYGLNIFFFKNRLFYMNREKIDADATFLTKEHITIGLIGRSHNIIKQLFCTIKKAKKDKNKTDILVFRDNSWRLQARQFKRNLSTVIIEDRVKARILNHINNFMENKNWYIENGIPYRTGILLQGPPGTGKTSLIKALCAEYDKPLYMLNLSHTNDQQLLNSLSSIPEGSIIAIEDIDTVKFNRKQEPDKDGEQQPTLTLGGLLNALDGVASNEDRIIIATTNHPERLDPALIREGRFDVKESIGHLTDETLTIFMRRFYPNSRLKGLRVRPNLPPCKAQKIIFDHYNDFPKVLGELTEQTST